MTQLHTVAMQISTATHVNVFRLQLEGCIIPCKMHETQMKPYMPTAENIILAN